MRFSGFFVLVLTCATFRGQCQEVDTNINPNNIAPATTALPGAIQLAPLQLTPAPSTLDMQRLNTAEISSPALGDVSPVAATSGISTPTGRTAPVFENRGFIANTVTTNPFQPPDLITASQPVVLTPMNANEPWSFTFLGGSSLNYDSNLTRTGGAHISDGYLNSGAGFDFRLGTKTQPFAMDFSYNYTQDIFDRHSEFNTRTHNFTFSSRIGRSSFVLVPYVVGRFRSVENQAAEDSGRQSYNFILAGVHGENIYMPGLVHTYDFSHTSVSYPARFGADFEIWEFAQQLNFNLQVPANQRFLQNAQAFPWFDWKRTVAEGGVAVNEVSGGIGGTATLMQNLTAKAKVGWGGVLSDDNSINYDSYSGFRYDAGLLYQPWQHVVLAGEAQRTLYFNPGTRSRYLDQVDASVAFPCNFGPSLNITPAFGIYRAVSNDYLDPHDYSLYLRPSLTVSYRIDDHCAVFGKVEYSDQLTTLFGTPENQYITDTQASVGFNLLF